MNIGFLLNHYAGHQAYHSLPIAFALSEKYPEVKVHIMVSNDMLYRQVEELGTLWPNHKCSLKRAHIPVWINIADKLIGKLVFIKKEAVLRYNTAFFKPLDVLVIPEKNSLRLKNNPELQNLKFVRIRHGAGDRNTGLDKTNKEFDFILASGSKMTDRLLENKFTEADKIAIIGYPKFDIIKQRPDPKPIFSNDKPTILYAPHYKKAESSWVKFGIDVLAFFKNNTDYNLIFAPHILLYKRSWRHGGKPLKAYKDCDNIYIDTGSQASTDMTYTRQADIYLGDVSSQVYEFLHTLKPCIFLDAHKTENWHDKESHLHWTMGDVLTDLQSLPEALERAKSKHEQTYREIQADILARTFDLQDTPSSERAADAIIEKFGTETVGK